MKQKNETAGWHPAKHAKKNLHHLAGPIFFLVIILITSSFASCKKKQGELPPEVFKSFSNKVILDWNVNAFDAMDGPNYQNTLVASRLNAMVHIAMHDALNSIAPVYAKYSTTTNDAGAHPIAAAATAAHTVLVQQFPAKKAMLDERLAKALDTIANVNTKQKGIALGLQCGNAIIELRKNDGAFQNPIAAVEPSNVPGVYQAVPPFDFVFAPFWKTMKPFGLQKPEQFRSAPYPALNSAAYEKDFNEVKTFGDKNSKVRTAEQTFYAKFWYEFSEIGWNRIARIVAGKEETDILSTARLFAILNIALADAYTAGWDAKFHYNFWRPFTAINYTASNGNEGAAAWEPLMPTPPVQDYPSTHSVLGNAGATVLTAFFGNNYSFGVNSTTSVTPDTLRSFTSFMKAADENADSRVMAGIHFRFSCNAGQEMGNKIGKWVVFNQLKYLD